MTDLNRPSQYDGEPFPNDPFQHLLNGRKPERVLRQRRGQEKEVD